MYVNGNEESFYFCSLLEKFSREKKWNEKNFRKMVCSYRKTHAHSQVQHLLN